MRTAQTSFGDLLFGSTRGRILGLLFGMPDDVFFARQIVRSIHVSAGAVQRELMTLTDAGIIARSQIGNQVFYRANKDHPAYAELKALLAKTTGVFHQLSEALAPLAHQIKFAFVYGSFARGDEKAASDIDLMVIGSLTLDNLLEKIVPVERVLSRPINPSIYSLKELKVKLKANNHFLKGNTKGQKRFSYRGRA